MTGGLSQRLAEHVAGARFEQLPLATVEVTKRSLLDAVGVMLGASGLGEGCDAFVDLARAQGEGPCRVLGHGFGAGLLAATLANGALAHALDYEDALDGAPIHPNAAAVPAALAVAQDLGGVSGRRLVTALALGCDLVCRLGLSLTANPDDHGWYPPPTLGAQGAAAAAAVLLGLDPARTIDAFGLTLGPSGQSAQFKASPDSTLRAVRDGFSAHAGVLGAVLAQRGVRAFDQPFEGKAGLFSLFARGAFDSGVLLADLGQRYRGEDVSFKPWPSCRGTHAAVEAVLALRRDGVSAGQLARVLITGAPVQQMLAEPAGQKQAPQTAIDAKFSLPFTVASAWVHGDVSLDSFSPQALADPQVLAVAQRVAFQVGEGLGLADSTAAVLDVELADGRRLRTEVTHPLGHPTKPMSDAALIAKFKDCAARSRRPLSPAAVDALADAILSLETIDDLDGGFFPRLA